MTTRSTPAEFGDCVTALERAASHGDEADRHVALSRLRHVADLEAAARTRVEAQIAAVEAELAQLRTLDAQLHVTEITTRRAINRVRATFH